MGGSATTWCTPGHTLITFPDSIRSVLDHGHEIVGRRPRGYRSPSWDFSDATLGILEEFEFAWDSSLMGRDFTPYRPRPVVVHREEPNEFGPPSPVLELPVSWYMDDVPALDHVPGLLAGLMSTEGVFARWRDTFDYAYENEPSGNIRSQSVTTAPN